MPQSSRNAGSISVRRGALRVESLANGRFVLREGMDRIGTSRQIRGVDQVTQQPVSMCSVDPQTLSAGALLRLEYEAEVLSRQRHPHLAAVLHCAQEQGRLWLVTAGGAGTTLRDRLQQGPPLTLLQSLEVARQVLDALGEMHRQGVLHTAVHPRCILLEESGETWNVQLQWPAALELLGHEAPSAEDLLEAARYAAPEHSQIIHGEVGEAADIYAVGCVLFHCLVGAPPFDGADLNQLLWRQATQPAPTLRGRGCDVPQVLDELLQRALARDPRDRYQTAEAVRDDLAVLIQSLREGRLEPDLVIGAHDHRTSLARPAFVARQEELAALQDQIQRTRSGDPPLTLVEGLSGYGKSRLLSEYGVRCAHAGLLVLEGKAVADVVHPFQILEGVAATFVNACAAQPDLATRVASEIAEFTETIVAALPGLRSVFPPPANGPRSDQPNAESQTLNALVEFLGALGTPELPAVVILDDCQWAEDFIYRLLLGWQVWQAQRASPRRFVQLVVSFRSDEVAANSPLRRVPYGAHVEVGPLGDGEVRRLLESMAGPLPEPAVEAVTRLADGSPFMASAVLHGLVESGALVPESDTWRVDLAALESVRSSDHAAGFLSQRLGRLDGDTLQLLMAGALLGAEFPLEMAIHLTGMAPAQAFAAVNDARQRQLLWWRRNEGRCTFVHDKIREALIARQSDSVRIGFHTRAADYLLRQAPESQAELALHLDSAGRHAEALPYAIAAAAEARRQHALELAEQQYRIAERARQFATPAIRFEIAEGLGDVQMLRGNYAAAEDQFNRAAQLAESDESRAEVCCKRGELAIKRGDMHAALAQFHLGLETVGYSTPGTRLEVAARLTWEVLVQVVHTLFGRWLLHRKQRSPSDRERVALRLFSGFSHACWYCRSLPLAMWAHLRGMNRGETYLPSLELAQAYSDHAPAMILVRWTARGIQYAERSLAIRKSQNDLWGQGQSLHYYGVVLYAAARYQEAIEKCRRAVQILERMGDYWQVHIARYQIAAARYHLGDLRGAIEEARRNHQSGLLVGDEQASGIILDVWARAAPGKVPGELLEQELQRERHDAQGAAQVLLAGAVQSLGEGKPREAVSILERAREIIVSSGVCNPYTLPVSVWLATAWRIIAENERSLDPSGRRHCVERAEEALRTARRDTWRFRNDLPQILREQALLQVMRGRRRRARRLLQRSLEIAESQEARYQAALTRSELARIGRELSWPDADELESLARTRLAEFQWTETDGQEAAATRPSVSLIDRFDTLLRTGRGVISALERETVRTKVEEAALRLLRAEQATVLWVTDEGAIHQPLDETAAAMIQEVRRTGRLYRTSNTQTAAIEGSALCVPIQARGSVVAYLLVVHQQVVDHFGRDEERIADFIATLAGAAFENAEGFAELERLNATLEHKVAERTFSLHERAEELARSNLELERTTGELRVTQDQLMASTRVAESANQAKSRFLAAISHEIRTPMNGVIGMAELALATELSERQRMYVATISQSARALLAMLNDVLDFSKIEAGRLELESRPYGLHETIVDSVRLLSVSAWQKGLDLHCRITPRLPTQIVGDSTRLRQVLLNLIGNAVKFTSQGGVEVEADLDDNGRMVLSVRDSGIGIPPDRMSRLFQAFDQGGASITRRYGGTGLGLAISSQLAGLMGGEITVESEAGVGSTFRVVLPCTPVADARPVELAAAAVDDPSAVVVISNSPQLRAANCEWLTRWGLRATAAGSTAEAMMLLVGPEAPRRLLIDVSSHEAPEIKLLEQLASARMLPNGPVIVLVPAGGEEMLDRVERIGGQVAILTKPLTPRELAGRLSSAAPARAPSTPARAPAATAAQPLRILVVDDSPINLHVAEGLLELLGHQGISVEGGREALERLDAEEFDAVFMDVEMPDMDGLTATRLWREREQAGDRPTLIYAMSAHVTDDVRGECLTAGMDGFLSKPVDPVELRVVLAEIEAGRRLATANAEAVRSGG